MEVLEPRVGIEPKKLRIHVTNGPGNEQPNSACAVETDPLEFKGETWTDELGNRFAATSDFASD